MSTVQAINFKHPSATTAAITMDSAGGMTGSFPYPNRNLLYNGAMQVHQRSTSVSNITGSDYYTADRWGYAPVTMGTWTNTIETDGPAGSGLTKSYKVLCTTADASPAAVDYIVFYQRLEGQDLQRVMKGTSSAQSLTLSFWVKSNVTGTYIANAYDQTNNRQISLAYTINASGTWEKKTIVFPPDTTGIFANNNSSAFTMHWFLGAGSTFTTGSLNTSWVALNWASNGMATGQVNVASATNNYWQITGVQLETGPVATPFEFKSYGQELRECQRYYCKSYDDTVFPGTAVSVTTSLQTSWSSSATGSIAGGTFTFPVRMRANPSSVIIYDMAGTASRVTGLSSGAATTDNVAINTVLSNSSGASVRIYNVNYSGISWHYAASAEL